MLSWACKKVTIIQLWSHSLWSRWQTQNLKLEMEGRKEEQETLQNDVGRWRVCWCGCGCGVSVCVCVCACCLYFSEASGFRKAIQFSDLDLSLKGTRLLSSKEKKKHTQGQFRILKLPNKQFFHILWLFKISDAALQYHVVYMSTKRMKLSGGWTHNWGVQSTYY